MEVANGASEREIDEIAALDSPICLWVHFLEGEGQ